MRFHRLINLSNQSTKEILGFTLLILMFTSINFSVAAQQVDLAGFNQVKTASEKLITGGQPSKEELVLLANSGVKNIINLRGVNEFDGFDEKQAAEALGIKYIVIPVNGAKGVTLENAEKLNQALSENNGLTMVHCASGNRAGALISIREFINNKQDAEAALQTGEQAGMTSLKQKVSEILQSVDNK
ncbi:fused DSP-PTPase phosphatase/NAD kinase-like protein [Aliikangiella maris]|uniref:Sulfur transferase domain-containing protein n=2 Tax=Aliikangiella maris TaxID=3162458 RepID=A0ABV3MIA9_9GAMM